MSNLTADIQATILKAKNYVDAAYYKIFMQHSKGSRF